MRCTHPYTVGYKSDGKTICYNLYKRDKQYPTHQMPCGQCLSCRLIYAREWAVRCVHEASMYERNSFITLTYSDQHLISPKLVYRDWQLFMKKLRKTQDEPIKAFVTGEYGERTKRPHWHAILFNYFPLDAKKSRVNDRGDQIFSSQSLDRIWALNDSQQRPTEVGTVTLESAGYCARYAAKKLVHSYDFNSEFKPISKKRGTGYTFLEKHWRSIFSYGEISLDNGHVVPIPRGYEKWLKEKKPQEWLRYVTEVKDKKISFAQRASDSETEIYWREWYDRVSKRAYNGVAPIIHRSPTRAESREIILKQKFESLKGSDL